QFRQQFDAFRSAFVNEPRGSDVTVRAPLCPPADASCAAGGIFFNNVAYRGRCGLGIVGLRASLAHLGRMGPGEHRLERPVGTGTSARLACLFADGKLQEDDVWIQESIVGSIFEGTIRVIDGQVIPSIKGSAFITGETTLILNSADPFCWGIRPEKK